MEQETSSSTTQETATRGANPKASRPPDYQSFGARIWAFCAGALGCYVMKACLEILHAGYWETSPITKQSAKLGVYLAAIFGFPAFLFTIVTDETKGIVRVMVWPWLLVAVIGAGAFGWSTWQTVVVVASIVAGLLGLFRMGFG